MDVRDHQAAKNASAHAQRQLSAQDTTYQVNIMSHE